MQEARSTVTGLPTTAWDFSRLPPATIAAQRREFTCLGCGCPAHFRRASSNGHDACFAGQQHAPDCELAVRGEGPWGPEGDEVVQRWQADRQRIRLALAVDADEPGQGGTGAAREQRGGGRHVGGGEPVGTTIQRGPKRLLNLLVTSQVFRTSTVEMLLPDGTVMPANRLFVTFDNADPEHHADHYHGFWGIPVRSATWARDGSKYLNTVAHRDGNKIAINIGQDLIAAVCARFRVPNIGNLVGKYVLAFGTPYVTTGGQFTLYVRNAAHMAVLDPADVVGVPA